ncbi:unnamed protein product [Prunus brigantina]
MLWASVERVFCKITNARKYGFIMITSILGNCASFINLGRCASCVEFRCGTVDIDCVHATCIRKGGCPNRWIGRLGAKARC